MPSLTNLLSLETVDLSMTQDSDILQRLAQGEEMIKQASQRGHSPAEIEALREQLNRCRNWLVEHDRQREELLGSRWWLNDPDDQEMRDMTAIVGAGEPNQRRRDWLQRQDTDQVELADKMGEALFQLKSLGLSSDSDSQDEKPDGSQEKTSSSTPEVPGQRLYDWLHECQQIAIASSDHQLADQLDREIQALSEQVRSKTTIWKKFFSNDGLDDSTTGEDQTACSSSNVAASENVLDSTNGEDQTACSSSTAAAPENVLAIPGQARYQELKLHLSRATLNGDYELAIRLRGQIQRLAKELRPQIQVFESAFTEAVGSAAESARQREEQRLEDDSESNLDNHDLEAMTDEQYCIPLREYANEKLAEAISDGNLEEVAYMEDILDEIRVQARAAIARLKRRNERSRRNPDPDPDQHRHRRIRIHVDESSRLEMRARGDARLQLATILRQSQPSQEQVAPCRRSQVFHHSSIPQIDFTFNVPNVTFPGTASTAIEKVQDDLESETMDSDDESASKR
ncbi:MAG: hypothetical protein M1812_002058 [Candelaria pacifica]|nr:MAG: hypothetical protein M1812_002058 [Candelaria pacifica]